MNDFELKFSGLSLGRHQFNYEVTKSFFDFFQDTGIQTDMTHDGHISFEVLLDKKENLLVFDIAFNGYLNVDCDRCLDQLRVPVSGDARIIGKFGESDPWNEDDVIVIPPKDYKINLSDTFYQLIHLALPAKTVHESGNCDPKMLEKLEEYKNGEVDSNEETDPRWNALKDLFKDKN